MSSVNDDKKCDEAKRNHRKRRANGFEEWGGYMSAKITKLHAQFDAQEVILHDNEQRTNIFGGVAIHVNGFTKPPADELKRLMSVHGGEYHHYYSSARTTHVVASNLPNNKSRYVKNTIFVCADWITESIKAGKLLSYQDFLTNSPEVADKQHRLPFKRLQFPSKEPDNQPASLNKPEPSTSSNHYVLDEYKSNEFQAMKAINFSLDTDINLQEGNKVTVTSPFKETAVSSSPSPENRGNENDESDFSLDTKIDVQKGTKLTVTSPSKEATVSNSFSPEKRGLAVKSGHPNFLNEFYNNSRLHHISTAGQELKKYVQHLSESNKEKHFPKREKLRELSRRDFLYQPLKTKNKRMIMHLDMDCFFVSVGLRKRPELRGSPVAVTHSKGQRGGPQDGSNIHYEASHYSNESQKKVAGLTSTKTDGSDSSEAPKISKYSKEYGSLSEIASCSYEARKAGVRNGMFLGEALRRCPSLCTIPYDFDDYKEVSKQLYDIVASYTLDIEAVSCDELYIDCTELLGDTKVTPYQFATVLREEINEQTGCTASAGLGSNMLISRLANKVAKPNGQRLVWDSEVEHFFKKQSVEDLPGVGYKTSSKLRKLGVLTCGDLQTWTLSKLQQEFGHKIGQSLYNHSRGKDDRVVQLHKDRKSVSAEINYGIRFENVEEVYSFINELAVEVQSRLQSIGCKGKALTLKLKARRPDAPVESAKFMGHGVCDTISKSVLLKSSTDSSKLIANECCTLARSLNVKPQDFRGLGIQMSKLEGFREEKSSTITSFLSKCEGSSPSKAETPSPLNVFHSSLKADKAKSDLVVKQASEILTPAMPERIEENNHKLSKLPKLVHMVQLLVQSCKACYAYRHELIQGMINSAQRLVSSPYATVEHKHLAVDLADVIIQWEIQRHEEETEKNANGIEKVEVVESIQAGTTTLKQSSLDSTEVKRTRNLSGPIEKQGDWFKPVEKNQADAVVKFLFRMACQVREASANTGTAGELLSRRCVSLLKRSRKQDVWPNAEIKLGWSDKLFNAMKELVTPSPDSKLNVPQNIEKPNLGGEVEEEKIKQLLFEWVDKLSEPYEEDVDEVKVFFTDAINEDLCKVHILMKYFYGLVISKNRAWKEAYEAVLLCVEQKVLQVHGFRLDL